MVQPCDEKVGGEGLQPTLQAKSLVARESRGAAGTDGWKDGWTGRTNGWMEWKRDGMEDAIGSVVSHRSLQPWENVVPFIGRITEGRWS